MPPPAFKFTPEFAVYPPKEQGIYPIRESDWLRLKRMISRIIPSKRVYEVAASALFGVVASALLSLVAFKSASNLGAWVLPTTYAILITSVGLGVGLIILDRLQKDIVSVSVTSVVEELQAIEQDYEKPQAQGGNTGASTPSVPAQQVAAADAAARRG
jgi:hypothetical protein